MKHRLLIPALSAAILAWTACSSNTNKTSTVAEAKSEPAGPPQPVSGKEAFYEMYKPARQWSADVLPLTLVAGEVAGVKNEGGKAGMWTAVFVSTGRSEARTFYYAVADHLPAIHKGVKAGAVVAWGGPTAQAMPFRLAEFTVDSDGAYKSASEKAAAWLKTHPGKQAALTLGNASRFPAPVWYVIWGTPKDGYAAYVSAVTGNVLGK